MTPDRIENTDHAEAVRRAAITLTAIAQSGLHYADDRYDVDRYQKMAALALDLLTVVGGGSRDGWRLQLGDDRGTRRPRSTFGARWSMTRSGSC